MNNPNPKNKISKDTLDLPLENNYLPKNFPKIDMKDMDHPKLIKDFEFSTLHYAYNNKFKTPKANIFCNIYCNEYNFTRDVKTDLLLTLY